MKIFYGDHHFRIRSEKMTYQNENGKIKQQVFQLLQVSLFLTDAPVSLQDWQSVFIEMEAQSVAALPGE